MSDICSLPLRELKKNLQDKKIGAVEATQACLERIKNTEYKIGALLRVDEEGALAAARELDARGPDPSLPLWGCRLR